MLMLMDKHSLFIQKKIQSSSQSIIHGYCRTNRTERDGARVARLVDSVWQADGQKSNVTLYNVIRLLGIPMDISLAACRACNLVHSETDSITYSAIYQSYLDLEIFSHFQ